MKEEGNWHWLYCCEEGWGYTRYTQGANKLTLIYSKEETPKKAFQEDTEHWVSIFTFLTCYLGFFLSQGGHHFHHLMLLIRLIQIVHLIVHTDLFKHTYNFTIECSMKIRFVVTNNLFRIQTWMIFNITNFKWQCH